MQNTKNFLCSFVYAGPHVRLRRELWQFHGLLSESVEGPWIIVGDFNCILDGTERVEVHLCLKWDVNSESSYLTMHYKT